jgi:uncharacterized protein (DUF433 family)
MTATIDISTLIVKTDDTCGGHPRIAGTRLSVQQIAVLTKQGLNPLEIIKEYENISLAQVHAALAYYYANQEEIEAYLAEEKQKYERLLAESQASQSS